MSAPGLDPSRGPAADRDSSGISGGGMAALAILLAEVAGLTFLVEVQEGPLQDVASPPALLASLNALAVWLVLGPGRRAGRDPVPGTRFAWTWLAAHGCLFLAFGVFMIGAADRPWPAAPSGIVVAVWVLMALGVAITAVLAFVPVAAVARLLRRSGLELILAAILGIALEAVTLKVLRLWPLASIPIVRVTTRLLDWTYGGSVLGWTAGGDPIVGAAPLLLRVTPGCSELNAIAAFWLLGAVRLLRPEARSRPGCWLAALVLGTVLLGTLYGLRIYGLVAIGRVTSPYTAVRLAHSRIGDILFLLISVGIWRVVGRRSDPRTG